MKLKIFVLVFVFLVVAQLGVRGQEEEDDDRVTAIAKDVFDRNLVRENVKPNSILNNYKKYCKDTEKRQFEGSTLAYITPWNKKGYENAVTFRHKLSHVSPVWFQIKPNDKASQLIVEGQHNIDKDWILKVRENSKTKILPRFNIEGQTLTYQLLEREFKSPKFVELLATTIKSNDFDGLVIEGVHIFPNAEVRNFFIENLSRELHKSNKELIIVIQPIGRQGNPPFTQKDIPVLSKWVDGFSLMTYDFDPSSVSNSPISWMEENLKYFLGLAEGNKEIANKIMMGLPFYGYKVSASAVDPVMSWDFVNILEENKKGKFQWVQSLEEHTFTFKNEKNSLTTKLSYPTLLFLNERLKLAKKYHCSISIWEIGQGMDYFFDLF